MAETKYLKYEGGSWYVRRRVPKDLVALVGSSFRNVRLDVCSESEARKQRNQIIAEWERNDIELIQGIDKKPNLALRRWYEKDKAIETFDWFQEELVGDKDALERVDAAQHAVLTEDAMYPEYPDELSHETLDEFNFLERVRVAIESRRRPPESGPKPVAILAEFDRFIADHSPTNKSKGWKTRTLDESKRIIEKATDWLKAKGAENVHEVDRKLAGMYVSAMKVENLHPTTIRKRMNKLNVYWKWLSANGLADASPWSEHRIGEATKKIKRPYKNAELIKILDEIEESYQPLYDVVRLSLFGGGMRLEEVCQLKVENIIEVTIETEQLIEDSEKGTAKKKIKVMQVRGGKTENADRTIPIVKSLERIIEKHTKGKLKTDWLIADLPDPKKSKHTERSSSLSKKFTRKRREILDKKTDGQLDFHSIRRKCSQLAHDLIADKKDKGWTPWTMAAIFGHKRETSELGLLFERYAGEQTNEAKLACVEAIELKILELMS